MSLLNELKDSLIFELQKEFWNERGKGARYRLTMIGVDLLGKSLKDPANIDEILALYKKEGFCDDVTFIDNEFSVVMNVKNCVFATVRDGFMDKGQQPLSCPLANTVMNALELKNGMSPELLPIVKEAGGVCKVEMAKIPTSDVVD